MTKSEWVWFIACDGAGIIERTNSRSRQGAIEAFADPGVTDVTSLRRKFPAYYPLRVRIEYEPRERVAGVQGDGG